MLFPEEDHKWTQKLGKNVTNRKVDIKVGTHLFITEINQNEQTKYISEYQQH